MPVSNDWQHTLPPPSQAVDLLIARLDRAAHSFPVSELAGRVVADKVKQGGRGSGERLIRQIEEH